ncbi:MAG: AraC family transcriptional regulator [Lysobacteraceae bacterium]|nr:MAG: AraC family transcriptional regulator [Xanthomonadaceae bacterium]
MQGWQAGMTGVAVVTAAVSLLVLLWRRPRNDAETIFAVVSGSMALSLMSPWMAGAPDWMVWAVAIGGSATCNGFWLVSRALFRGEGGVGALHVSVAACVALLIAGYRIAASGADGTASPWASGLDSLLTLASSTLLVLTFLEALRGWSAVLQPAERRMRVAFMLLFATVVLTATLVGALGQAWPAAAAARGRVIATCAVAMILFTHWALRHRHRMPLPQSVKSPAASRVVAPLGEEEVRLAKVLRHQLEVLQVYREPELKVVDLARRIGTAEHKLSRLITQSLGEKNFNQMINRHRIEYACRRLAEPAMAATILDISADAGFASLGPFNRAFKAAIGCTPTAYRATCRAQASGADAAGGYADPATRFEASLESTMR